MYWKANMLKKLFFIFYFYSLTLSAVEIVWDEKSIKTEDLNAIYNKHIESTYPVEILKYTSGNVIKSPYTGKVWLDRNLGAKRVCAAYNDIYCYGELFQWGSGGKSLNVPTDSSWRGVNATNNPCPKGFRVPLKSELHAETNSIKNREDALSNFLKLPSAGYRSEFGQELMLRGASGSIWTSSTSGNYSFSLYLSSNHASWSLENRRAGSSVRCLKN